MGCNVLPTRRHRRDLRIRGLCNRNRHGHRSGDVLHLPNALPYHSRYGPFYEPTTQSQRAEMVTLTASVATTSTNRYHGGFLFLKFKVRLRLAEKSYTYN